MSQPTQSQNSAGDSGAVRPAPKARPLTELSDIADVRSGAAAVSVTGVTLDSRRVTPGDLYCALPGANVHGAQFARQAVEAGCAAILTDPAGAELVRAQVGNFPLVLADDPRAILGWVSAWVYGDPSRHLKVVGITGTDGKTTTAMLAEAGLRAAGLSTGLVGTVATRIGNEELPSVRTTPEAPDLQALLAVMVERGVDAVVMEVSSHAIALGRVSGIDFDLAIFTNLGHDHLDFHGTQEEYFRVKAELFTPDFARAGVVCLDDDFGVRLAELATIPVETYSVPPDSSTHRPADWTVRDLTIDVVGWRFTVVSPVGQAAGACQLPGVFNVRNALAAIAAVTHVGGDLAAACEGVAGCGAVPGRMQPVGSELGRAVLVDYAHTPDAVARAIEVGRDLANHRGGRVLVVLGCGGDRDSAKRPIMGSTAARLADVVVITDDNPRSEDPALIRREMMVGVGQVPVNVRADVTEIPGREAALREVIRLAQPQDVVLALGKGHETTQEASGVLTALDDRAVLASALLETTE